MTLRIKTKYDSHGLQQVLLWHNHHIKSRDRILADQQTCTKSLRYTHWSKDYEQSSFRILRM